MNSHQNIEFQAKIYVYDLNNCAREFGFKTDESWEINMATGEQKADIEKKYFPTLSARVLPEILVEMLGCVRFKLHQGIPNVVSTNATGQQNLNYLVAFNPTRLRG